MSPITLITDLSRLELVDEAGGAYTPPTLTQGDKFEVSLITKDVVAGELRRRDPQVRNLRASIGKVQDPPAAGVFKLRFGPMGAVDEGTGLEIIGGTSSLDIAFNATAAAFKAAITSACTAAGLAAEVFATEGVSGCWVLKLTSTEEETTDAAEFAVIRNSLQPESFVRIRSYQEAGAWRYEVKLIQAPLFYTNAFTRVLPPALSTERVRLGGMSGSVPVNELQAITIPDGFQGTFYLKWNFRTTRFLGVNDGPEVMAAALNAMFDDGKTRFTVVNIESQKAHVEFVGPLAGASQNLIEPEVATYLPGVLTFVLNLRTANLATALRTANPITVPLEVELEIVGDGEDASDPDVPSYWITAFRKDVTIFREQIFDELGQAQPMNWLLPAQPKSYIPFTLDQVITGNQHYVTAFGDGEATSFVFTHNLGTEAMHVAVRQNVTPGRLLSPTEYEVTFLSESAVQIDCAVAPGVNGLAVTLTTAGPVSAFVNNLTLTLGQVLGLAELLNGFGNRLGNLEDKIPYAPPSIAAEAGGSTVIPIPNRFEAFPGRYAAGEVITNQPKAPLKVGALLPAIHVASFTEIVDPLPDPADAAGTVLQNSGDDTTDLVPGGYGYKSAKLSEGDFIGSDGRLWYPVVNAPGTRSYYPRTFDRELFFLTLNEKQLRAGTNLVVDFTLGLQLLEASSKGQWVLEVLTGTTPQQTTPAPIGVNLSDIVWNSTPLISQRIVLSTVLEIGKFGVVIARSPANVITASRKIYGVLENADAAAPASANFALRARLVQFDTENSVADAKGTAYYALTDARATLTTA